MRIPDEKVSLQDLDNAPSGLPPQLGPIDHEKFQSLLQRFSDVTTEKVRLQEENTALLKQLNTSQILDQLIKPYANRAFWFMCAYCGFVAYAILASGFKWSGFKVDASVLEFLVGSTAVTVIGLVGMVLTGIFVGARKLSR